MGFARESALAFPGIPEAAPTDRFWRQSCPFSSIIPTETDMTGERSSRKRKIFADSRGQLFSPHRNPDNEDLPPSCKLGMPRR